MNSVIRISSVIISILLVSTVFTGAVVANDEWADDTPEEVSFGTHSGAIQSDDDVDTFEIPVSAGDVIDLGIEKASGEDVYAHVDRPSDDGGYGGFDLENEAGTSDSDQVTIKRDGFLEVSVYGDPGASESYSWSVSVTDAGATDSWIADSKNRVSLGTHSGATQSDDDVDTFEIPVSAGDVIDLGIEKDSGEDVYAHVDRPSDDGGYGGFDLENEAGTSDSDQVTIKRDGFLEVSVYGDPGLSTDFSWAVSVTDAGATDSWIADAENRVSLGTHSGATQSDDDVDTFEIPVSAGDVIDLGIEKASGEDVYAHVDRPSDDGGYGGFDLENEAGTSDADQVTIKRDGFL